MIKKLLSAACRSSEALKWTALALGSLIVSIPANAQEEMAPETGGILEQSPQELALIETAVLNAYGQALGQSISESELRKYLAKSDEAASLASRIEKDHPKIFGGVRILKSKNFKAHFYFKGSKSRDILAKYTSDKNFIYKPSQYSLTDLRDTVELVMSSLRGQGIETVVYIDVEKQDVVVAHPDIKRIRGLLKTVLNNKNPVRLIAEDWVGPFQGLSTGGLEVDTPMDKCSAGIAVRKDGKDGMTTAGHCGWNTTSDSWFKSTSGQLMPTKLEHDYFQEPNPSIDIEWHTPKNSGDKFLAYVQVTPTGYLKVRRYGLLSHDVENLHEDDRIICKSGRATMLIEKKIKCATMQGIDARILITRQIDNKVIEIDNVILLDNEDGSILTRSTDSGAPYWIYESEFDGVRIVGWHFGSAKEVSDPYASDPEIIASSRAYGQQVSELHKKGFQIRYYPQ